MDITAVRFQEQRKELARKYMGKQKRKQTFYPPPTLLQSPREYYSTLVVAARFAKQ